MRSAMKPMQRAESVARNRRRVDNEQFGVDGYVNLRHNAVSMPRPASSMDRRRAASPYKGSVSFGKHVSVYA